MLANANTQDTSPFNKKKHTKNDPAKPHPNPTPAAQQTRKTLMSDGVDCSILMGFPQFMKKYLSVGDSSGFPEEKAQKVQDAFIKTLGLTRGPGGRMVKNNGSLTEKEWSQAWQTVAEDTTLCTALCPGFVFNLSEEGKDKDDNSKLRIDASLISVDDTNNQRFEADKPNWSLQRLPIEFKRGGATYDPFDDNPKHKHEADSADRRGVYEQLMTYAERVFVHQHRKHLFFLFINGPEFRVMFFDHGGVITTEAIDYISSVEGTAALLSFLHAFSELDDRRQGVDTTAILLSPESRGYKRMDALKDAQPDDLAHHARYVDDASTIPDSFLDSTGPAEAVDATDYGDPTHECEDCDHEYPEALPVFTYVRDAFRKSLEADPPSKVDPPRYMVKVGDRHYLIGDCVNDPPKSLVGRGTKGYVALEWETQRFVFLKDTWRSYYVDIKPEGEILQELNTKGVPNVPTVIAHGDVEDQETETTNYSPVTGGKKVEDWTPYVESVRTKKAAKRRAATKVGGMKPNPNNAASAQNAPAEASGSKPHGHGKKRTVDERNIEDNSQQGQGLRHLIHYRLVLKEVCLPLTEITSSKQLVSIISHGIVAHEMAYVKCNLIHRDVSFGNVLIRPLVTQVSGGQKGKTKYCIVWQGLLADWELAKDWTIARALQPERTGTWHFMSWYTLTYTDKPVFIPDELESFVHVLIYAAVRLVNHNLSDIRGFIDYYFDGYVLTDDGYGCPPGKSFCITKARLSNSGSRKDLLFYAEGKTFDGHPLNGLLRELLALIRSRYIVLESQERTSPDYDKLQTRSDTSSASDEPSQPPSRPPTPLLWDPPSGVDRVTPEAEPMDVQDRAAEKVVARQASGEDLMQADPSPETIALAKSLEKHSSLLEILRKYLDPSKFTWPRNDIVPDRLKKFRSRPRESLSEVEETSAPKKARTDSGAKPAAASSSKNRGRKATGRLTRQKTRSGESLGDHGTAASSSRPAASGSGGATRRVTRSASRLHNGDPGADAPEAGPSNAPSGSQSRSRTTRTAGRTASGPSSRPGGSIGQDKPKVPRTYLKKTRRGGQQ